MGLFNRKKDNRVKCPRCNGQGAEIVVSYLQNPEPRPKISTWDVDYRNNFYSDDLTSALRFSKISREYSDFIPSFNEGKTCNTCKGEKKVSPEVAANYIKEREKLIRSGRYGISHKGSLREQATRFFDQICVPLKDCRSLSGPLFNTMSALERIKTKEQISDIETLNFASQKLFSKILYYENDLKSNKSRQEMHIHELVLFEELRKAVHKMIEYKAQTISMKCLYSSSDCRIEPLDLAPKIDSIISAKDLQRDTLFEKCKSSIEKLKNLQNDPIKYQKLKLLLNESFTSLRQINVLQAGNLNECNSVCEIFLIELDKEQKMSKHESKEILESIYTDFNEYLYKKANQMGLRYASKEINGVKVYYLDYWNLMS